MPEREGHARGFEEAHEETWSRFSPAHARFVPMSDTIIRVMPSATPTEEEIAAWNELPRDEQLKRYRELFSHPDCNTVSGATMEDILTEARRRSALRRG